MKSIFLFIICSLSFSLCKAQNALTIPPPLAGPNFQLNVQSGSKIFYPSTSTPTYGVNGPVLAPTLIVNKGDSITLAVHNGLNVSTTMHWHGLHVSASNDGGPNKIIAVGATWTPSFIIRNNAGTFWYHPHGAGQTDPQVSKGLAGMIIIHDSAEAQLNLPTTYGIDDIPLIVQSKAFDVLQQIAISTEMDTAVFVNATVDPIFQAPAQVVRFRLLNGSSMRTYNFGFSANLTFHLIATDGGLIDTPIALTRLRLSPGERAEILVNFQGMNGQSVSLMSYASGLSHGIYGSAMVGLQEDTIDGYSENFLNGADFTILKIGVTTPTGTPVTTIPASLVPLVPFDRDSATTIRTLMFDTLRKLPLDRPNLAEGPFGINNRSFSMDSIDITIPLNSTEIWTLKNNTYVAHPFHIHDVQFNVIEQSGGVQSSSQIGWKDVVLVPPLDSVKFITKFETFADASTAYMYHCHLLHHEDDGMMGQFIVSDIHTGIENVSKQIIAVYPNPADKQITVITQAIGDKCLLTLTDVTGREIVKKEYSGGTNSLILDISLINQGLYNLTYRDTKGSKTEKIVISH